MLIDTGMPTTAAWDALTRSLAEIGVVPESLRHIVLTHMHPDHCGLVPRLRDLSSAEVWLHPEDAELLDKLSSTTHYRDAIEEALLEAGTPAPLRSAVLQAHDRFVSVLPAFTPARLLEDGLALESRAGPLQVIHTPGHSPGHCCLFAPESRVLISSDHILEDITPHVGWLPEEDMLGRCFQSLDRVAALDARRILPAHGFPFTGLAKRAVQIRRAHQKRLNEIEEHLQDGARTADDLVRRLWPRDLRPFEYHLALTTILACREHTARQLRISQ
jgi:glyoxylase-like metal-dependent hydrolase (beta-lactamase superfamily II)